jgi:hypothetical protein
VNYIKQLTDIIGSFWNSVMGKEAIDNDTARQAASGRAAAAAVYGTQKTGSCIM